jgi:hypothetical protein
MKCVQPVQFSFLLTDRWVVGRQIREKYGGKWNFLRIVPSGGLLY